MVVKSSLVKCKEYTLHPYGMIGIENRVFFSDLYYSGLYSVDVDSLEVSCKGSLYTKSHSINSLYSSVVSDGENAFFIPYASDHLCIYNYDSGIIEAEPFPYVMGNWPGIAGLYSGTIVDTKLFLFGYENSVVCSYDMENREFTRYFKIEELISNHIDSTGNRGLHIRSSILHDNDIYAVSLFCNQLMRINKNSDRVDFIETGVSGKGFSAIVKDDPVLWLIPYSSGELVKYNTLTNEIRIISIINENKDWTYTGGVCRDGNLYILPAYYGEPLCIAEDDSVHVLESIKNGMGNTLDNHFQPPIRACNYIISSQPKRNEIMMYSFDDCSTRWPCLKTNVFPLCGEARMSLESELLSVDVFLNGIEQI